MTSARSWWRVAEAPGIEMALTLAAVVLLLRPMGPWYVQAPLLFIGALSIVRPTAARTPGVWLAATIAIAVRLVVEWPLPDNHIYLLAYWCLRPHWHVQGPSPEDDLAGASRLLIAGAMTMAVLWKAFLSPDYMDGRFFRVTLIDDPRFEAVAMLAGGLTDDQLEENRAALDPLPAGAELLDAPVRHEPPGLRGLARALTWGGVGVEALLAIAMWIPEGGSPAAARTAARVLPGHLLLRARCGLRLAAADHGPVPVPPRPARPAQRLHRDVLRRAARDRDPVGVARAGRRPRRVGMTRG